MSGDAETVREIVDSYRALLNSGVSRRADYLTEEDLPAYAALERLVGRVADAEEALQGVRLHVDAISILARSPYPTEHAFAAGMLRIAELAALSGAVEAGVAQNSWRERAADAEKALREVRAWSERVPPPLPSGSRQYVQGIIDRALTPEDSAPSGDVQHTPPGDFYPSDWAG